MNQKIMDLIQRRRLQLIVHSRIYYKLNNNIISDMQWDAWARELVQLQKDYPKESEACEWFKDAFQDWDASTGAFLPLDDPWVIRKAKQVLSWQIVRVDAVKKQSKSMKSGRRKLF